MEKAKKKKKEGRIWNNKYIAKIIYKLRLYSTNLFLNKITIIILKKEDTTTA